MVKTREKCGIFRNEDCQTPKPLSVYVARTKNIVPPSLRLKFPIKTKRPQDIVHKTQKELTRDGVINNKLVCFE